MKIILASQSPRRQGLLKDLGYEFEIIVKSIEEIYPATLLAEDVPCYLAKLKAEPFKESIIKDELIITSDTIVVLDEVILGKPQGEADAKRMLKSLSGKEHLVISGVCLTTSEDQLVFKDTTKVKFKDLSEDEIDYYIKNYQPFDKAGAYGIQEWIGLIGVEKIEGSYFNVMGLPVQKLDMALINLGVRKLKV